MDIAEKILDFIANNQPQADIPHYEYCMDLCKNAQKIDVDYWFQCQGLDKPNKISKNQLAIIVAHTFLQFSENNNMCMRVHNSQFWAYNGYFFANLDNKTFTTILLNFVEKSVGLLYSDSQFVKMVQDELYNRAAPLPTANPDKNTIKINFKNGVLCIKIKDFTTDFEFLKRTPEHGFSYCLPYEYDPNATKKPIFDAFINKVLPDKDLQNIIGEYIAYALMGNNPDFKHEKALLLHGTGSNGKSVMFEIITALLGQSNITNYSLRSLTDSNGYARAQLSGKLLNYCTETGTRHNSDMLKALISGEPIEARLPYRDPFIVKDYAKFIFNTNELPQVEHTDAFFRRLIIIPFNVTIKDSEKDTALAQKIIASELPAIMNWVISRLVCFIENKAFSESKASKSAVARYKRENDSVLFFVAERYEKTKRGDMPAEELYESYRQFCIAFNFSCVSYKTFLQRLKNAKLLSIRNRKKLVKVKNKLI